MDGPSPPSPASVPSKKRRPGVRWLRRLAVVALAVLACYLARGLLLRGAAGLLVDEDPAGAAEAVLPLGGAQSFVQAAGLCRSGQASSVLLIPPRPGAAQTLGALPTDEELMRRELAHAQSADRTLEVVPCPSDSDWSRVRLLGTWLAGHPNAQVTALCGRLQSARWRRLLRGVLPGEAAARVRLRALSPPDYDETDWWDCKAGVLDMFNSSLSYAHVLVCGEDEEKATWDPDQYEKSLR